MAITLQQLIDAQKTFDPVSYTIISPNTGRREIAYAGFTADGYEGESQATSLYVPESDAGQLAVSPIPGVRTPFGVNAISPMRNTMGEESGLDTFMEDYAGPLAMSAFLGGAAGGFGIPGASPSGLWGMFNAATAAGGAAGFDPTAVDAFGTGGSEFLGAPGGTGAGAAGASAFDPLAERLYPSFAEQSAAPISSITPVANSFGDKLAQLGIPGAQKLFGSAGDAAARIAAGAAGAGGAKKLKDMFSTGDGDYQFPWEDVIGAVGEAYGANEYQKGLLDVMNKAVDRADPFASQRPGWQTEFNKMRDDPDYWSGNGVFGNIVNTAQDSSARKLASQGYNMSGNFATGVNKAGVTAAMPYANDYMKIVGNAAGANIDPGNAGNIMSTMGTAAAGAGKDLAGAIGYGAQSVMNGRQPSGLDQLFGTNKNKTLFNAINWGLS